jgi:hypothetical protein
MKNKREIYEALLAGKTVQYKNGDTMHMNSDGLITDNLGSGRSPTFSSPEDWREVEPPKRKVKMAPSLFRNSDGVIRISDELFISEEDAKSYYSAHYRWLIDTAYELLVEVD